MLKGLCRSSRLESLHSEQESWWKPSRHSLDIFSYIFTYLPILEMPNLGDERLSSSPEDMGVYYNQEWKFVNSCAKPKFLCLVVQGNYVVA